MRRAYRASVFHCLADPGETARADAQQYFEDAVLVVDAGRIDALAPAGNLLPALGDTEIVDLRGKLLVPGFIDCHVHFPQLDIIAAYGEQLLDWLTQYAYPAEARYADAGYAAEAAGFFLDQLLAHGTTTAAVFGTVHEASAEALFAAAHQRDMRLIAGKVLMDVNCPPELRDGDDSGIDASRRLIEKWHGRDRLGYAITPRFALTSSEKQLAAAGALAAECGDTWIHTHLAENRQEIAAVRDAFPSSRSYLDVYARAGLLRERAVFAHCLHLDDTDRRQLAAAGGAVAFCPTSNLFLGSGLFDLRAMRAAAVRVGLGSDVGGGTSLSMLRTMSEAYKVLQLQSQNLPASRALYLATLGAAEALCLEDRIGSFEPGKEADFVAIDTLATPVSERRMRSAADFADSLFAVVMLGDERHVAGTFVRGEPVSR
ncbi:MAG: guanine deaminase [Woeseiaceae bacterium]|nr:guanine deaminase [Woeseiaceae bacterium]